MILKSILLPISLLVLSTISATGGISLPMESEMPDTTQSMSGVDAVYDGCGTTKGCFGVPGGASCIKSKNCTVMTTFRPVMNGTFYDVEIYGCMVPPDSYVAIGVSADDEMGDDSVIQCVNYKGALNAYNAVNIKGGSVRFPSLHGFKLKSASHSGGRLYCRVMQPSVHSIMNEKNQTLHFDFVNENYYLLMASGPSGPDQIKYHMNNRCISDGLVKEENLLIGDEDETKVDADDKLMLKKPPAVEVNKSPLLPVGSPVAN